MMKECYSYLWLNILLVHGAFFFSSYAGSSCYGIVHSYNYFFKDRGHSDPMYKRQNDKSICDFVAESSGIGVYFALIRAGRTPKNLQNLKKGSYGRTEH